MRKKRPGRKYPRGSVYRRNQELVWTRSRGYCEVTGAELFTIGKDGIKVTRKWACHHVLAERHVRRFFKGVNPHIVENMIAIIPSLHSKITAAEAKLMKADWLGYRNQLNILGFPLSLLDDAFAALCAEEKLCQRTRK